MPQRDVMISTPDGTCDATLHTPDGSGPWPAVIMYPDAGGVRGTFHQMAQRLADLGYAVLLPNIYYRSGGYEPFDLATVFTVPEERARLMSLAGSVTKEVSTRDTDAMLQFLADQPEVADTKVGTTGYCLGGGLALNAAGRFPDRVGAAASFHGGYIATHGARQPSPARWCHERDDLHRGSEGRRVVRRRAVRVDVRRAHRSGSDAHACSRIRPPTASPFPTTRPSTPTRPSATGRRSKRCTRPRSADVDGELAGQDRTRRVQLGRPRPRIARRTGMGSPTRRRSSTCARWRKATPSSCTTRRPTRPRSASRRW